MFLHTYCLLAQLTCKQEHHEVDSTEMHFHCYKILIHFQIGNWYLSFSCYKWKCRKYIWGSWTATEYQRNTSKKTLKRLQHLQHQDSMKDTITFFTTWIFISTYISIYYAAIVEQQFYRKNIIDFFFMHLHFLTFCLFDMKQ